MTYQPKLSQDYQMVYHAYSVALVPFEQVGLSILVPGIVIKKIHSPIDSQLEKIHNAVPYFVCNVGHDGHTRNTLCIYFTSCHDDQLQWPSSPRP